MTQKKGARRLPFLFGIPRAYALDLWRKVRLEEMVFRLIFISLKKSLDFFTYL